MLFISTLLASGWFLLTPPTINDEHTGMIIKVRIEAPISSWEQHKAYDSAALCERDKKRIMEERHKYATEALLKGGFPRSITEAIMNLPSDVEESKLMEKTKEAIEKVKKEKPEYALMVVLSEMFRNARCIPSDVLFRLLK